MSVYHDEFQAVFVEFAPDVSIAFGNGPFQRLSCDTRDGVGRVRTYAWPRFVECGPLGRVPRYQRRMLRAWELMWTRDHRLWDMRSVGQEQWDQLSEWSAAWQADHPEWATRRVEWSNVYTDDRRGKFGGVYRGD